MPSFRPLVSAVVPTHRRAHLVARAVWSALAQTLADIEVIVVVDGADEAAARALRQIDDRRLRLLLSPDHLGNAEARNAGVAEARAPWVAFLDDDDLWLPAKLERQLEAAERSSRPRPIIGCRLIARTESNEFVWPRRVPAAGENISEYLFCRTSFFSGDGVLPTSAIFTSTSLVREVPFRKGLLKHVDPDWLCRAAVAEGAGVEFVADPEPLAIWHIDEQRGRVSNSLDWRYSMDWIRENRQLVTSRAYASFALTVASANAAGKGDWRAFPLLLAEAWRRGTPSAVDVGVHVTNFFVPAAMKRMIARASAARAGRAGEETE